MIRIPIEDHAKRLTELVEQGVDVNDASKQALKELLASARAEAAKNVVITEKAPVKRTLTLCTECGKKMFKRQDCPVCGTKAETNFGPAV